MGSPLTDLTDKQIAFIDGGPPSAHGTPFGTEAKALAVGSRLAEVGQLVSNTAVIPAASANVVLAVGAAYDGKPTFAMIMQDPADGTLTSILRTHWDGSGNLTVEGNAAATADTTIAYFVDGR